MLYSGKEHLKEGTAGYSSYVVNTNSQMERDLGKNRIQWGRSGFHPTLPLNKLLGKLLSLSEPWFLQVYDKVFGSLALSRCFMSE